MAKRAIALSMSIVGALLIVGWFVSSQCDVRVGVAGFLLLGVSVWIADKRRTSNSSDGAEKS